MRQSVLDQAAGRFRLAERAFAAICEAGEDQEAFQIHWLDFLIQWKGAYTKVQQAAKDTPQELQWFGGVARERKADPLLRYLFEARNDGEHGINYSARHAGSHFRFVTEGRELLIRKNDDGSIYLRPDGTPEAYDDGKLVEVVEFRSAESCLLEVKEYDGKKIVPPPTMHLGHPMEPKPHIAADLGLKWLKETISSAGSMLEPWQAKPFE